MEAAIQTLVKVFLKSAKGRESLGKKEFQGLVKSQLSNILSGSDSKEAVDSMGQDLDANQDGKVGFEEYMKLVGYLAVSLSEQRNLVNQEPAANAASEQVAQSAPAKGEEKSEAEATDKATAAADAKVEATAEPKVELKVDAKAKPTVDLKVGANASPKVEVNAEGAKEPVPVGKEKPAAVVMVASGEKVTAEKAVTEVVKVVTTEEKVKDVTEEMGAAAEEIDAAAEEMEKKIEEATS